MKSRDSMWEWLRNEGIIGGIRRQQRFLRSCKLCSIDAKTSIRKTVRALPEERNHDILLKDRPDIKVTYFPPIQFHLFASD